MREPVRVKLKGLERIIMVGVELMETGVERMIKLLRENKSEFTWSSVDMPRLDLSMDVHKLYINPIAKEIV